MLTNLLYPHPVGNLLPLAVQVRPLGEDCFLEHLPPSGMRHLGVEAVGAEVVAGVSVVATGARVVKNTNSILVTNLVNNTN